MNPPPAPGSTPAASLRDALAAARIVPVIRHDDPDLARQASDLLVAAGLRILEITTTVPGAVDLIRSLARAHPELRLGAGTVLDAEQARSALRAGATFLVSPCWCDAVAEVARREDCPYLPGAMTPGEVHHHWLGGAAVVKVFPAGAVGGPGYLRALGAVFPTIPLMPTGGIDPAGVPACLEAGALCVGMGGRLLPFAELTAGRVDAARSRIRAALTAAGET